MQTQPQNKNRARTGRVVHGEMTLWMCALALVVTSAIFAKERGTLPALAQVKSERTQNHARLETVAQETAVNEEAIARAIESSLAEPEPTVAQDIEQVPAQVQAQVQDISIRWFDGKAVRPVRTIYMTVTGYSPDARSCGIYADGKTSTMHSVWTNGMNLVAADPRVLPYWSMISIPGYADDSVVPVLDCGGAIKGNRLDLLYPTHELALQWGIRQLPVTVWEYVENGAQ